MGAVAGGGGGGGQGRATAHSAFQVACVYSDIDTTKVDVGAYASRIVAAQQPIPAHQAKSVHRIMDSHDCYVRTIVWDPFRNLLVSGGGDGWIRLWSTDDYSFVDELSPKLSVRSLAVLTKELVSGHSNGEVMIWDMEDPFHALSQQLRAHEEAVYAVVVLRNGDLVSGAEDIRVFSRGMFGFSHILTISEEVLCMTTVPSSNAVLTGNMNSLILVWDSAENWEIVAECKGHKRSVWTLTYIRDSARCASGGADHSIRIWNPANWECEKVLSDHTGWVVGLSYSPGMLLSCSIDSGIRLWNVKNWQCERTFTDQDYEVYCVCAFAGGRFCTGGAEMAILVYGGPEHDLPHQHGGGGTAFPGMKAPVSTSSRPLGSGTLKEKRRELLQGGAGASAAPRTTSPRGVGAQEPPRSGKNLNLPSTWGTCNNVEPPPSSALGMEWVNNNLPDWFAAPIASVAGALTPRSANKASQEQQNPPQSQSRLRSKSPSQRVSFADVQGGSLQEVKNFRAGSAAGEEKKEAPQAPQLPQSRRRDLQAGLNELDFTMSDFREHLVEVEREAKKRQESSPTSAGYLTGSSLKPSGVPTAESIGTSNFGARGRGSSPRSGRAPSPKPVSKVVDNDMPFDDMMFETVTAVPSARDLGLEQDKDGNWVASKKPTGGEGPKEGVTDWSAAFASRGRS